MFHTDLVKVRIGFRFSHSIEVLHVDQLEVEGQARVWYLELRKLLDVRQVPEVFVSPVVKVTKAEDSEKDSSQIPKYY